MALVDHDILITPNKSSSSVPNISFVGADSSNSATITLNVLNSGTSGILSFEGTSGQLLSLSDNLSGTLFTVNDVSGIPIIEVVDSGEIKLSAYDTGLVSVRSTDNATSTSTGGLVVYGGVGINKDVYIGGDVNIAGTLTASISGTITTSTTVNITDTTASASTFYPTFSSGSGNAGLNIDSTGFKYIPSSNSLGLGKTPSYNLDINGTARLSGDNIRLIFGATTSNLAAQHRIEFWEAANTTNSTDANFSIEYDGTTTYGGDGSLLFKGSGSAPIVGADTVFAGISRNGTAFFNYSVGIGTQTPQSPLEVYSSSASVAPLVLSNSSATNGVVLLAHNYIGSNEYYNTIGMDYSSNAWMIGSGVYVDSATSRKMLSAQDNYSARGAALYVDGANGTIDFYTSNTLSTRTKGTENTDIAHRLTVAANGRIGIGTTSPSYSLHIVNTTGNDGSHTGGILIQNTGSPTGEAVIGFMNADTTTNAWKIGLNQDANLAFNYGSGFIDGDTKMSLGSDGNLIVGGPDAAFTSGSGVEIQRAGTATLRLDSGTFATELYGYTGGTGLVQLSSGYLDLGTANTTRIRIDGSGNVGLGTTDVTTNLGQDTEPKFVLDGVGYLLDRDGGTARDRVWGTLEPRRVGPSSRTYAEAGSVGTNDDLVNFPNVYGEADLSGITGGATFTYSEAVTALQAVGARLPTLQELMAGVGQGSGQGYDSEYLWTQTWAGHRKVWVCKGHFGSYSDAKVVDIDDPLEVYYVRGFFDVSKANMPVYYDDDQRIRTNEVRASGATSSLVLVNETGDGLTINSSGDAYFDGTIYGNISGTLTGNAATASTQARNTSAAHYPVFVDSNNSSATAENLYTTSTFAIDPATQRVGIGTSAPQTMLNLYVGNGGTNGIGALRIGGTSNYGSLELGITGAYGGMVRSYGNDLHYYAGHWRTVGTSATENHSHYWYTSKTGSSDWSTVKMELDHDGNLGIGTTTPLTKLHVAQSGRPFTSTADKSNGDMTGIVITSDTNQNTMSGVWFSSGNDHSGTHWSGIAGSRSNYSVDWSTHLSFYTHDENTSNITQATEKARIDGAGDLRTTGGLYAKIGTKWHSDNALRGGSFQSSINNNSTALKIFPAAETRAVGNYNSGIGFMHLDPDYSSWGTSYVGAQAWIGMRITSTSGQEQDAFVIATNGSTTGGTFPTERVTVLPGGFVGVGSTAPGERLTVNGNSLNYGSTGAVGTGVALYLGNAENSRDISFTRVGAAALGIGRYNGGWYESIRVDANGNIGVNNTSPSYKLDFGVLGDTAGTERIRFNAYNGPSGGVSGYGGTTGGGTGQGTGIVWQSNYPGYSKRSAGILQIGEGNYFRSGLAFYTNNVTDGTTDWSEALRISSNGNVGIGTTSPLAKFEVVGSAGQLFSVYDSMSGTIFAVNDVSGIPSIEVIDTGLVKLGEYNGQVAINTNTAFSGASLTVDGMIYSGEIRSTNEITAYYSSDARLKENVKLITDPISIVNQIRGVTFDWTEEHIQRKGGEDNYFVRKHDIGVIAQEVEAVLPDIVATKDDGYKAVKYEKIVPVLIEAIKTQQTSIDKLTKELSYMKEQLDKLIGN